MEPNENKDMEQLKNMSHLSDEDKGIINRLDAEEKMHNIGKASSSTFVKAEDKYSDYVFSAYTFLVVGIGGLIFDVLNMVGVLSIIPSAFSQWTLLLVLIAFVVIGFGMLLKASSIKTTISDENRLANEIKNWLKKEITKEYLDSLIDDDVGDEVNFFTQTEEVKERLMIQFDDLEDIFADSLIEEHLDKIL